MYGAYASPMECLGIGTYPMVAEVDMFSYGGSGGPDPPSDLLGDMFLLDTPSEPLILREDGMVVLTVEGRPYAICIVYVNVPLLGCPRCKSVKPGHKCFTSVFGGWEGQKQS